VLDNGADETGVYDWFAKSLALPKGAAKELSGATGSDTTTIAVRARITASQTDRP
jgi:hypothetical protein